MQKGTFSFCPFVLGFRNVHSDLKKVMARKRIYPNVISFRLTENDKAKLETIIQHLQTNKSEFLRDKINRFIESF